MLGWHRCFLGVVYTGFLMEEVDSRQRCPDNTFPSSQN